MATVDPFDFDTYFLQRMSEFFGPDFENLMGFPTTTDTRVRPGPATIRPASRRWIESEPSVRYPHEAADLTTEEITEMEQDKPSTRELRRAFRQYIPIDISDTENGYLVEANLPGIPKENVQIHVDHNNVLTIDAWATPSVAHACAFLGKIASELHGGASNTARGEKGSSPKTSSETTPGKTAPGTDIPTPRESPTKEKTSSTPEEGQHVPRKFMLSERCKGRLHRSIRLPKYADPDKAHSCIENGVLCLFFEKIPAAQAAKRIELH